MSGTIAQDAVEAMEAQAQEAITKANVQGMLDRVCDGQPFALEITKEDVEGAICGLTPVRVALSRYGFENVDDQASSSSITVMGTKYGFRVPHEDHWHWRDVRAVEVGFYELTPIS